MKKTTIKLHEVECGVCGTHSDHYIITDSSSDGAPDLDFRPSYPHRASMKYWVMECPECGFCSDLLNKRIVCGREYLESEEYNNLGGLKPENELAAQFIKAALVFRQEGQLTDAVKEYLYAAWVCDDDKNDEAARSCRMAAIAIMDANPEVFESDDNTVVLKADMLRRCGEFDRVTSEFNRRLKTLMPNIVREFEIRTARKLIRRAYRCDEIPGIAMKK
ncbi:MAG: hypothetical protein PUA81_03235 [Oscillospiraceae bacterium]|nr:hypothetical protein [Oscillospiraceae bacterium]